MALPTALLVKGGVAASTVALGGVAIFQRENIYYLIYPNDNRELNKKIRDLGISGCELENEQTKKENCSITGEQLKNVKFSKGETEVKVTEDNKTLTLTIEKLTGDNATNIPSGLLFTFTNADSSNDVTIGSSSDQITLKANTSYDFKMKSDESKLEKAWDLTTLGAKVGLTCNNEAGDDACECDTSNTSKINVWKSESNYLTGATGTSGKKISVTKDTSNYKQGFKFEVKDSGDISLTGGTSQGTAIDKLTKTNTTYEIDLKEIGGTKKWFLVEKSTTPS